MPLITFPRIALAAICLTACVNEVREEPGRDGANLNGCNGQECPTTSGGNPEPASQAVAMLYSEVPWGIPGSGSSTSSGGSIDPDTLYIFLRDDGAICADPFAEQGCGGHWSVTVAIPPQLQQPGVLQLASPDLISVASVTGPDPNDCWFGGGSFTNGTVEIVSIDDNEVVITLSGTDSFDFHADGNYVVPRCP